MPLLDTKVDMHLNDGSITKPYLAENLKMVTSYFS